MTRRPAAEPTTMRDCLRDRSGRPVPWANLWSGELPETRWEVRPDRVIGQRAIFSVGPREGEPDFTRQAPQRQREAMFRQLCQVCAGPAGHDAVLVLGQLSVEFVMVEGQQQMVVTEPWLCLPCAEYALSSCPGLLRQAAGLMVVRPVAPSLVLSSGWVEGELAEETMRHPVGMWIKLRARGFVDLRGRPVKVMERARK